VPTDFRVSVDALDHPKLVRLVRMLGADGVLTLFRLWGYTASYRPTGTLDGMSVEDIEIAARWHGEQGLLIKTLVELRLLDLESGTYRIHHWADRNSFVASFPERSRQAREAISKRWENRTGRSTDSNTSRIDSVHTDRNTPLPSSPVPSSPIHKSGADAPISQSESRSKRSKASNTAKHPWPEDLTLTEPMREFARKLGIDAATEFAAWKDDCAAHGREYVDWPAAWRTRCHNAIKFGKASNGNGASASYRNGNGVARAPIPRFEDLVERDRAKSERPS
jgi:hypothetical protein